MPNHVLHPVGEQSLYKITCSFAREPSLPKADHLDLCQMFSWFKCKLTQKDRSRLEEARYIGSITTPDAARFIASTHLISNSVTVVLLFLPAPFCLLPVSLAVELLGRLLVHGCGCLLFTVTALLHSLACWKFLSRSWIAFCVYVGVWVCVIVMDSFCWEEVWLDDLKGVPPPQLYVSKLAMIPICNLLFEAHCSSKALCPYISCKKAFQTHLGACYGKQDAGLMKYWVWSSRALLVFLLHRLPPLTEQHQHTIPTGLWAHYNASGFP